jgi:hypothetical protein
MKVGAGAGAAGLDPDRALALEGMGKRSPTAPVHGPEVVIKPRFSCMKSDVLDVLDRARADAGVDRLGPRDGGGQAGRGGGGERSAAVHPRSLVDRPLLHDEGDVGEGDVLQRVAADGDEVGRVARRQLPAMAEICR